MFRDVGWAGVWVMWGQHACLLRQFVVRQRELVRVEVPPRNTGTMVCDDHISRFGRLIFF